MEVLGTDTSAGRDTLAERPIARIDVRMPIRIFNAQRMDAKHGADISPLMAIGGASTLP